MEDNLHDEACEKAVLGTLLSDKQCIYEVREILNSDCFYTTFHKDVYNAILRLIDAGNEANIITIIPELQKTGKTVKPSLIANLGSYKVFELKEYALHLSELDKRRQLFNLGLYEQQKSQNVSEDIADIISYSTDKINAILGDATSHIKPISHSLVKTKQKVDDDLNGVKPKCSHTGFHEMDKRNMLQPNNLIVLAADSSMGKTALANTIVLNAAQYGGKMAYYSLEMTDVQITTRLVSMESGIPCQRLFNEKLNSDELSKFDAAMGRLNNLSIYFDDRSTSNIDTIISSIRTVVIKNHIDGVVIDYLQLLSVNARANNVETQLAESSRRLKNLAKELNIWILLLSQLSRNIDNPEPNLARLRGSGQINEAADTTILLYRPQYYTEIYGKIYRYSGKFSNTETKGTALINVAKGRNTGPYQFIVGFTAETTKFYDLDSVPNLPFAEEKDDSQPF